MEQQFYSLLQWLPDAPADINQQIKDAASAEPAVLRQLAGYRLGLNQLKRLSKTINKRLDQGETLAPLARFNLGIVSNKTTELIPSALIASAARHGVALRIVEAPYNQVMQIANGLTDDFSGENLDAILLAIDLDGLPVQFDHGAQIDEAQGAVEYLETICTLLTERYQSPCIVQNCAADEYNLFGSFSKQLNNTRQNLVAGYNLRLGESLSQTAHYLFDVESLAASVGISAWHDPVMSHVAKLPFAQRLIPLYCEHLARVIGNIRGSSRRALILDLDNTLWGGVIGDDGLEGIRIGQGDPLGEAHLAVQQLALAYKNRGIVLAVCSKNEADVAKGPFREHPDMLLREADIAVFVANWTDKASNIRSIAQRLNLGLESFVFLDDNPMERDLVRTHLPEVAVPELPEDVALYPRTLVAAGYFEATQFSDDDRIRVESYRANAQRAEVMEAATDMDSYLRTLNMQATCRPFDEVGLPRIAQLISKSNQWNLTTHRRNETQVSAIMNDERYYTLQVRLADSFGDNGMVCVMICEKSEQHWEIDTWLMSCRVLGRRLEELVLSMVMATAKQQGATVLKGVFKPTAKNGIVAGLYERLGFTLMATQPAGDDTNWQYLVADYQPDDLPIGIVS